MTNSPENGHMILKDSREEVGARLMEVKMERNNPKEEFWRQIFKIWQLTGQEGLVSLPR